MHSYEILNVHAIGMQRDWLLVKLQSLVECGSCDPTEDPNGDMGGILLKHCRATPHPSMGAQFCTAPRWRCRPAPVLKPLVYIKPVPDSRAFWTRVGTLWITRRISSILCWSVIYSELNIHIMHILKRHTLQKNAPHLPCRKFKKKKRKNIYECFQPKSLNQK